MTTDHEAAEMGKARLIDRFVDWLTYDPHAALKRANEEIARIRLECEADKERLEEKIHEIDAENDDLRAERERLRTELATANQHWVNSSHKKLVLQGENETLKSQLAETRFENKKLEDRIAAIEKERDGARGQAYADFRKVARLENQIQSMRSAREALHKIHSLVLDHYAGEDDEIEDDQPPEPFL